MSNDQQVLIFDPEGDIVLSLEVPHNHDNPPHENERDSSNVASIDDAHLVENSLDSSVAAASENEVTSVTSSASAQQSKLYKESASSSTKRATRCVEMRVSSRHLALASPVFSNMMAYKNAGDDILTGKEHVTTPEEGNAAMVGKDNATKSREADVTILLEGDDFDALQILLNIIHGFTRRVPRVVSGYTLWECVKLIDKYEFNEVAELYTDMWYAELRSKIPQFVTKTLGFWIFVCSELKKSEDFARVTKSAILETNCEFPSAQEAWIRHWIRKMQSRRQSLLAEILSVPARLLPLYEGPIKICWRGNDCDALALGKLIRGLKSVNLYPIPKSEELKISVQELFSIFRNLDLSTSCRRFQGNSFDGLNHHEGVSLPTCHLDEELRKSLLNIETGFQGLDLDEMLIDAEQC